MRHFTSKEVEELFPDAQVRSYPSGQIVIYEGDQPAHMFYVKKGALKNYDIEENGSEKIMHIIGEHSFFSVLYSFGDRNEVNSFYSTLTETEVILIPIDEFRARMWTDVSFTNEFLGWFVVETSLILDRVKGLEKTEGRLKLANALEYLAKRHSVVKNETWQRVSFPVSQQFLADLIGLTRETVSTIMKDFDEQKIVHCPRQMVLDINPSKLSRLSGS